ncbi:MAG: tyrosine-type recombinase/integrase [Caldilineaceae bacterium]|nr:tyrosine-type recombinase/integrase [Caldilineaceae bacterium]
MIYLINLDSTVPALDAKQLVHLIELFLADHRRKNQPTTVKGYRFRLKPFINWWQSVGPDCGWILSGDDFADYVRYLDELGWGYNSRRDGVKRLRQVFRWAHQRGHVPVDFALYIPSTKGAPPVRPPLSLDDLAALLNACWRMAYPLRNRAIIAALAGTGLRREECAALRTTDLIFQADGAGYLSPPITKNDKPRVVAFDAATGAYLRQWLDVLPGDGPLFPSRNGGASLSLSPDGLYKVVLDAAALAGVRVETHDLRRMFATTWSRKLRGEAYGQLLQLQMGHASYNTTAIYNLQQAEDVLNALRSAPISPIAQIGK